MSYKKEPLGSITINIKHVKIDISVFLSFIDGLLCYLELQSKLFARWFALRKNPEKPHTTEEIESLTKVPEHYLSKVLLMLAKHEVVYSKKRLHGGYILAQLPENLPLLNVINAVDYQAY
jgi:hypothetical protein